MSSAQYTFAAPIGGTPFDLDFAPSIVFAVGYAAVTILALYRLARSKSRTLSTFGTLAFVIEHIVMYSLRAKQAHTPSEDNSTGLTQYWQTTFSIGYLSIFGDCINVLRALLVNTTVGTSPANAYPLSTSTAGPNDGKGSLSHRQGPPTEEDQPQARAQYRGLCGCLQLFALIPIVLGVIQGVLYTKAETDSKTAPLVLSLRFVTTGMALAETIALQVLSIWSYFRVPRIRRSGALTVAVICSLLNVVSVYRLAVSAYKTTSLTSLNPHSLNTHGEKAVFYVFHAAPEWLAAAILFAVNVRETFGTGLFGDYRSGDKKPRP